MGFTTQRVPGGWCPVARRSHSRLAGIHVSDVARCAGYEETAGGWLQGHLFEKCPKVAQGLRQVATTFDLDRSLSFLCGDEGSVEWLEERSAIREAKGCMAELASQGFKFLPREPLLAFGGGDQCRYL